MDKNSEKEKLESIASWYSNRNWGFYTKLVCMGFVSIENYFKKGSVLEVGPADGEMTRFLLNEFEDITVLDASEIFVEKVKKLDPKIKGYVSLIEYFEPFKKYDNIIFAHVLEHVKNPILVLKKLKSMLKVGGRLFIIVPNANSLHRQVGVKMGLLKKFADLNEQDIKIGHRRVYTFNRLKSHLKRAGLKIIKSGGIFLKPLSNQQIEEQWSEELIKGYFELGKEHPEIASEIFVVCKEA